jgi:hypothetical protein
VDPRIVFLVSVWFFFSATEASISIAEVTVISKKTVLFVGGQRRCIFDLDDDYWVTNWKLPGTGSRSLIDVLYLHLPEETVEDKENAAIYDSWARLDPSTTPVQV